MKLSKKIILKIRKIKIKNHLYNAKIDNSCIIFNLLYNNVLDNIIINLIPGKIRVNKKFNNGKKYISKEKQFIILLNQFITFSKWQFYFLDNIKFNLIIEKIILSKYNNIFLSKYTWGSNKYMKEYNINFKKMIIHNFVLNAKYCHNIFNDIFKKEKINISNIDIDNKNEIEINKILNILRKIFYASLFNFEICELVDFIDKDVEDIYKLHYIKILKNYKNNFKMLKTLIQLL